MKVKVIVKEELCESNNGSKTLKIPIQNRETIDTLMIKLSRRNPKLVESILDPRTGGINEDYKVSLNGRSITTINGLHTKLKNKDEVTISSSENGNVI